MADDSECGDHLASESKEPETKKGKFKKKDLLRQNTTRENNMITQCQEREEEYRKDAGYIKRPHFIAMDAYARHKKLVNDYLLFYGGKKSDFWRDKSRDKTDQDVLKLHHKFLWDDGDDLSTWEKRLAKKYYDKLFREYCITDLSRYKENKIAMRWRIEKEVIEGKGQFICGSKKCTTMEGLRSWEVNFAYDEDGERKNALVKLRLCPECSYKLNYNKKRREVVSRKKRKLDENESSESEPKSSRKDDERTESDEATSSNAESADQSRPSETKPASQSEETSMWSGPMRLEEEKSREDEFDEYLSEMLM